MKTALQWLLFLCCLGAVSACEIDEEYQDVEEFDENEMPDSVEVASDALGLNNVYYVTASSGSTGVKVYAKAYDNAVLRLLAPQAAVKIVIATPTNGRYRVDHAGVLGWISISDLTFRYSYAENMPLSQKRINALARARQGMGFSYWWGNAKWDPAGGAIMGPYRNTGICTGSCPACTHTATYGGIHYGADCAGFVSTIWGLPDFDPMTNPANNGFTAGKYYKNNPSWSTVSLEKALPGDAMVSPHHIYLLGSRPDAHGYVATFECVSCGLSCRTMRRNPSPEFSSAHAIRRFGWKN